MLVLGEQTLSAPLPCGEHVSSQRNPYRRSHGIGVQLHRTARSAQHHTGDYLRPVPRVCGCTTCTRIADKPFLQKGFRRFLDSFKRYTSYLDLCRVSASKCVGDQNANHVSASSRLTMAAKDSNSDQCRARSPP